MNPVKEIPHSACLLIFVASRVAQMDKVAAKPLTNPPYVRSFITQRDTEYRGQLIFKDRRPLSVEFVDH